jgi:hypothetical protein
LDVLSVGDDLRATVFGDVAHLFPQLLHFLIFCFPLSLGTTLRPFCFTKTPLARIAESVQRLLECWQMYHPLHGSGTDTQRICNLLSATGDSGKYEAARCICSAFSARVDRLKIITASTNIITSAIPVISGASSRSLRC